MRCEEPPSAFTQCRDLIGLSGKCTRCAALSASIARHWRGRYSCRHTLYSHVQKNICGQPRLVAGDLFPTLSGTQGCAAVYTVFRPPLPIKAAPLRRSATRSAQRRSMAPPPMRRAQRHQAAFALHHHTLRLSCSAVATNAIRAEGSASAIMRTHLAPTRVLPSPRSAMISYTRQLPGGSNCAARAQSGQFRGTAPRFFSSSSPDSVWPRPSSSWRRKSSWSALIRQYPVHAEWQLLPAALCRP